MNEVYYTIVKEARSEFSDRGSKFLGYVFPVASVEEGKARLQQVKKEHPKATHHCFAWRIGQMGESIGLVMMVNHRDQQEGLYLTRFNPTTLRM
jgi:putative IMPACT (imprinted ancient) family translation regulator